MKRLCFGTFAISILLIILCVLVSIFLPNSSDETGNLDNFDELNNVAQIEPDEYHSAVVLHSEKKDSGLELYRSIQARSGVVLFYTNITGDTDVTMAILEYADKNSIPLSLAFSLAYAESRFNVKAVNSNTNKSIDRGLFQLNDKSFPGLTEKDFFNPYVSAKCGMAHLRFCIDYAGNEIAGLAMYNAGSNKVRANNTPQRTLNYVSVIMNYREGLEELFRTQVVAKYQVQPSSYLAKAE